MDFFAELTAALEQIPGEDQNSGPLVLTHRNIAAESIAEVIIVDSDNHYNEDGEKTTYAVEESLRGDKFVTQKLEEGYEIMTIFIARDWCYGSSTKHILKTVLVKKRAN